MARTKLQLPSTRRSLPIALMRSREKVMAPIRDMLRASGLTEQQWRVLRILSEFGPQDLTEIARQACLLMPSLSRMIRSLADNGLVIRASDAKDRRRQTVVISPAGQQLIDDNLVQATQIAANYRDQLGAERYELLLDLLTELEQGPPFGMSGA
ncbi:MAG: homoprotocatechuate degradation operon regulator HpaR [Planktomarina sp.]|jgi:homoprotocatechuate degradation regulator HpaR|nr:homoprotocatechuate degradation operon regulator HpaR [Planktomarina sp.]MDG1745506.1 homoprotocatechuate degradation operon regulator HpaR [Planktomarina sp.]